MWFCVHAEGDRGTIRIAEFCRDHLPESITTCGGEWRCAEEGSFTCLRGRASTGVFFGVIDRHNSFAHTKEGRLWVVQPLVRQLDKSVGTGSLSGKALCRFRDLQRQERLR